jgi:hypothetical protein
LARKALKGKATAKFRDPHGKVIFRSTPNTEVRRKLKTACEATELRVRRLRWWQSLARRPVRHAQVFGALLGQCKFEGKPTTDEQGHLTEFANSWVKMVLEDLECYMNTDSGYELKQGFTSTAGVFRPETDSSSCFANT